MQAEYITEKIRIMKIVVLDFHRIENVYKKNYVLLFTSEPRIRVFNSQTFSDCLFSVPIKYHVMSQFLSHNQQQFVTLNYNSILSFYNVFIRNEKLIQLQLSYQVDTFPLSSSIAEVNRYNTIAVGSYEGNIQIYDVRERRQVKVLEENILFKIKDSDIRDLIFCDYKNGYIVSYGQGTVIGVWDPNVKVKNNYLGKLQGHIGKISVVRHVVGTGEVISLDRKLILRVWNLISLKCSQVIKLQRNVYQDIGFNPSFELAARQIWIFSERFQVVQNTQNLESINENDLLDVRPCVQDRQVMVVHSKQIKFYSLLNGNLNETYTTLFNRLSFKIKKFDRDYKKRLFFILDDSKTFKIFKEVDSMLLTQFQNIDISDFFVLQGVNKVLFVIKKKEFQLCSYSSLGIREIKVGKESFQPQIKINKLSVILYSKKFDYLFLGDDKGIIQVYSLKTWVFEGFM